ncbi:hypothetical protein [Spirosoma fluminis]
MPLFHELAIRTLFLILAGSALGPTRVSGQFSSRPVSAEISSGAGKNAARVSRTGFYTKLENAGEPDSLWTKRSFFSTAIIQHGNRLDRHSISQLLSENAPAQTLYQRGQLLKPIGPLLGVSGLVISYIALKGTPKTAYARGVGTPTNPSPPDVLVEYTSRSLPALLGGVGLVVGGLCLIEISNGLTAKSIRVYNASILSHRPTSGLQTVRLGVTTAGTIGFEASF